MTEEINKEILMNDEKDKIPTSITINGVIYEKIALKGKKLFEYMKLAKNKSLDRSFEFKNIELKKFREPMQALALRVKAEVGEDSEDVDFEKIVEEKEEYRNEFVNIILDYTKELNNLCEKIVTEADYEDLVDIFSMGFEIEKELVEEFTYDNFMTAVMILNRAFPSL